MKTQNLFSNLCSAVSKSALLAAMMLCFGAAANTANAANAQEPFSVESIFSLPNQNLFDSVSPDSIFVVNTTGDQNDQTPGDGFCDDGAGNCSLRAAIQEANAFAGANSIDFNIPGGCGQVIQPLTTLPAISDSVTINGYSALGALPNTSASAINTQLCIALDGINLGSSADGL